MVGERDRPGPPDQGLGGAQPAQQDAQDAGDRRKSLRLSAVIRGRVQGVGFRAFAVRRARMLGLAGFVKNHYDGSVLVVAEGEEAALRVFLDALSQGPSWARVREVETSWSNATGDYEDFHVVG